MPKQETKQKVLITLAVLISISIVFIAGFAFGHIFSKDKDCLYDPLGYGIKKFNLANHDADFNCVCSDLNNLKRRFSFDKDGYQMDVERVDIVPMFSVE